jgi:hypothetical protein
VGGAPPSTTVPSCRAAATRASHCGCQSAGGLSPAAPPGVEDLAGVLDAAPVDGGGCAVWQPAENSMLALRPAPASPAHCRKCRRSTPRTGLRADPFGASAVVRCCLLIPSPSAPSPAGNPQHAPRGQRHHSRTATSSARPTGGFDHFDRSRFALARVTSPVPSAGITCWLDRGVRWWSGRDSTEARALSWPTLLGGQPPTDSQGALIGPRGRTPWPPTGRGARGPPRRQGYRAPG